MDAASAAADELTDDDGATKGAALKMVMGFVDAGGGADAVALVLDEVFRGTWAEAEDESTAGIGLDPDLAALSISTIDMFVCGVGVGEDRKSGRAAEGVAWTLLLLLLAVVGVDPPRDLE